MDAVVKPASGKGCEGCKTNVTVYTSAPKAELYCNGKRIASVKVKECKAVFKRIEYVPGCFLPLCMMKTVKKLTGQSCFPPLEKQMIQLACDKQTSNAGFMFY